MTFVAEPDPFTKWRNLVLIAVAELLAMGLWFSGSTVIPQLIDEWQLSDGQQAWMTMAVQVGFVAGTLVSALFNLADRIPAPRLIAFSTLAGVLCTAAIAATSTAPGSALVLRFLTGVTFAGIYPPGMKVMASWTRRDRGLGIGFLIGALAFGTALPHLLNALPGLGADGMPPWRTVLWFAAGLSLVGAILAGRFVATGPFLQDSAPFEWRYAGRVFADRPARLANFGYLGHMWELYAMWTWVPVFLIASYRQAGWGMAGARWAGYGAIAIGAAGSLIAGLLADRYGRTVIAAASLAISGSCCLVAGFLFGHPAALTVLCLVWGFAAIADSAQFSAAISELCDPRYVGTALTIQTSAGFLLTLVSIRIVPPLAAAAGWEWAFIALAPGPAFGIWAMWSLRRLPEARRMASGNR